MANLFTNYYTRRHNGRKLSWLSSLSKGELKMKLPPAKGARPVVYTLQCSGYQLGILLHFNGNDTLSVGELVTATSMNEKELVPILKTLIKTKVLTSESDKFESDSKLSVNNAFKTVKGRLKVNINVRTEVEKVEPGKASKEDTENMREVMEERKILVQASIVRIMKQRKRLNHTGLITEVLDQLQRRFKPQVMLIKKCIEMLIEKEYLQRVVGEKDLYEYLA
jgi:cullin 1